MPITNIYGTENADHIVGTLIDEQIWGLGGDDFISGQGGDDILLGGDGDDVLVGDYGNDQLYGQAGNDVLFGGYGNDVYRVDDAGDSISEIAGAGTDLVISSVDWILNRNVENLILTNSATATPTIGAIRGTGNGAANVIDGNNLNNVLNGLGGNDVLNGYQGNDRLNGGVGDDWLDGGLGNDILYGGTGSDIMNGGFGRDTYLFTQADVNTAFVDTVRVNSLERDRIDLRQIDAIAGVGNQAFTFIGNAGFSGTAGELRMEAAGSWQDFSSPIAEFGQVMLVSGDINGDGVADFQIRVQVSGSVPLDAGDFWL